MNFTAPAFVLLFPIVLALHWMLPPSRRWVLLLAASLGFYAVGSPQALPLLAGITLGTYAAALGIAKSKTQTAKKLWLTCAAVLCIGCLCLFKYAGIFRTDVPLLLPAGISFYTFQTLSYVIDIYRGRLMPERYPGYYALFVSFFPQLVAGPIERSTALLPQLHAQERRMDSSGWLFGWCAALQRNCCWQTPLPYLWIPSTPPRPMPPARLFCWQRCFLPGRSTGTFPAIPTLPSGPLPCWVCD